MANTPFLKVVPSAKIGTTLGKGGSNIHAAVVPVFGTGVPMSDFRYSETGLSANDALISNILRLLFQIL
jgi:hypothetical protein